MYIFPLSAHSLSKKVADGSKTFVFVYQTSLWDPRSPQSLLSNNSVLS